MITFGNAFSGYDYLVIVGTVMERHVEVEFACVGTGINGQ
jgi:hypothetical protein